MTDYLKETIDSYDKTVKEYIKKVDPLHPFKASTRFMSDLKAGARILDLGCGPGRDAKIFVEKGFEVTGIDLSKEMVNSAKKRVKKGEFKIMDLRELKFKDEEFDAVWASACYVHIKKQEVLQALLEVKRVLRGNGLFYLSVKQGKGESLKKDKRYGGVEKFWVYYEKKEIEDFLVKTGFQILEIDIEEKNNQYATNPWLHVFCKKV